MHDKIKKILTTLMLVAGLSLLLYPWVSNWIYNHGVESSVGVYQKEISDTDSAEIDAMMDAAHKYNTQLAESQIALTDPFVYREENDSDIVYESVLSLDSSGLMCFINIPKINVNLPVYHGTSENALKKGVGHLEGTSIPVGGNGTRAVLSAHTGINSSKMFTDLTEMEIGDLFFINVLNKTLAYRICDIQVILPEETGILVPEKGRDLVTLLTCTPYGVNTHRLVVTGERTEYTEEAIAEAESSTADTGSQWMVTYRKAILIGLTAVVLFAVIAKLIQVAARHKKG